MSAAACKEVLCSWDAMTAIDVYMVDVDIPSKGLRKSAVTAKDYLLQVIDLAKLLSIGAAGGFNREISFHDGHDLIELIEVIETGLAGKPQNEAKAFLDEKSVALKAAIAAQHDCVTGETTTY